MIKLVLPLTLLLSGCGGGIANALGGGNPVAAATIGAGAARAADYVKEAFTPEYKLHVLPLEFCFQDGEQYTCFLSPCEGACTAHFSKEEWDSQNGKVASLRTSVGLLNAVLEYCKANREQNDFCIEQVWVYEGTRIVVK